MAEKKSPDEIFDEIMAKASSKQSGGQSSSQTPDEVFDQIMYRANAANHDKEANRFIVDVNKFSRAVDEDTSGENRFNAADYFEERKQQAEQLKQRAAAMTLYMDDHRDSFSDDSYERMMNILSTFDTDVDDVMSRYQPSLDSKAGMRAYEEELRAAMDRNAQLNQLEGMAAYALDPGDYWGNLMRQGAMHTEGNRGISDNWSAEQRYRLGQMQMNDPNEAKKYAAQVNAGQDPYLLYQQQEQQKANWRALDLNAEKREIDRLKAELDAHQNRDFDFTSSIARKSYEQETQRLEKEISDREQQYNLAKREQDSAQFRTAVDQSDFAARSGYVSTGEIPTYVEDADPNALVYEYINNPDIRSQINQQTNELAAKGYDLLNEEDEREISIYNYYYATEGPERAQQYLDSIQDKLNQRIGERGAAAKQGNIWKQLMAGAIAGYSNAVTSPQYFFDKDSDYINTNPSQYMSAAIWEDMADTGPVLPGVPGGASLGQMAYDLVNTTANMAPAMLLSGAASAVIPGVGAAIGAIPKLGAVGSAIAAAAPKIGAAVGSTAMGLSAAGGAYQQALNAGYSKEQARNYAALSGASEIGLEYLLGGISKLGGEIPQSVIKEIVGGVDNAIARAAITLGGSMASEGFEEGLQEVITPWIENLTLYAGKNVDWNEVAYSTLLGALSGGVMEGPGVAVNTSRVSKIERQLQNLGAEGNTLDLAELIVKHRSGEQLSEEEFKKLVKSEPAMKILEGMRSAEPTEPAIANMTAEQVEEMKPTTSKDGNARQISRNESINVMEFAEVKDGKAKVRTDDGTVDYQDVSFATEKEGNQYFAVESLQLLDTEHANKLLQTIQKADVGKDTAEVLAIREAYRLGYMDADTRDLRGSDAQILSTKLQDQIYDIGRQQRSANDAVRATVKTTRAKATEGYKKVIIEGKLSNLTEDAAEKRKVEIDLMDSVADEFSGTAVHVYESYEKDGKRYYKDNSGKEQLAPNGKYVNDEIWVDLNSGDKGEGMMLNTFAHEMYHHIEKWNKPKARELAEFVVKELGLESVDKAVDEQIKKARAAGYGEERFTGMTPEQAKNEVYMRAMSDFVADSLETMFTRGDPAKAIANLKKENRGLFDQIKAFIDEWISKVKKFYSDKTISKEGAMVAQLEKFEQLQQLFMEAMAGAGENYNAALKNPVQNKKQDDVAQFSNRLSGQITEQDQKYLDAINRGDMDAAQRMVEDAARKAGYDSPKLYHGTNSFGFTKFDPQKSDDRISIFATSNSQVAETYSGETARRKISEKATITPEALESASPEELLKLLQENISKEYRIVSDAERSQIIEANRKPLLEAARSIENLYVINMDMFDSAKKDALFAVSGILRDMAKAEKYSDLMDKKMSYDDALWDLRWMDDSLTDEVISAIGNKENLAFRELTKWLDKTMFHADSEYSKANGTPWMNSVEAVNELYPRLFKGVYELYGRTGNAFEMMADGANWNQLDGSKIGQYGPVRTRDVSRYAYDSGYDSVIFRDIRDNADYTYSGNSDVYVFFGSNMLKSADTVTYDDDGNVIPLSERFNPEIDDVRYSIRNSNLTSNRYWYPAMKKSEIAEVKNLAKHEAKSTDNYLGIGVKWLYNNKKGHRYFALYSTADENSPTVLYACKGDQAEFEHDLLLDFVESERGLNESLNRGSTTIDRLFDSVRNAANRKNVSSDRTLGAGSNARNVSTNSRNRRKKASPAFENCLRNLTKVQTTYGINDDNSRNSLRNQQPTAREILMQTDPQTQKNNVKGHLTRYQERVVQLGEAETRREEVKAKIEELAADPKKNRKELAQLRTENRNLTTQINGLKEKLKFSENTDMMRKIVANERLKNQPPAKSYKDEQEDFIRNMLAEHRVIRKELTGADSVMFVMEDTFVKLAKDYETKKIDMKTMEKEFMRIMKEYEKQTEKSGEKAKADSEKIETLTAENKIWLREYKRLMKEYDLSDRKIARLEATIARQRSDAKAKITQVRETQEVQKQRKHVEENAKKLMRILTNPTKDAHAPMALQEPLQKFLDSIDFTSNRYASGGSATIKDRSYINALAKVRDAIKGQRTALTTEDGVFTLDVPPEFTEEIDKHINMVSDATEGLDLTTNRIYEMTSAELKDLNYILNTINKAIRDIDRMHMQGEKARTSGLARDTMQEMQNRKPIKGEKGNWFMWNNYTPFHAFRRYGKAAMKIFDGLKAGQAKLARTIDSVVKFTEKTYTAKEVKDWEHNRHEIKLDSGKTVAMSSAQIMTFWCLSHRDQAIPHMQGAGIRMTTLEKFVSKANTQKELVQKDHFSLTLEDVNRINQLLTDRQRTVAREMQQFMQNFGGKLVNEISMARWDFMAATEKDYFPIDTVETSRDVKNPDQKKTSLFALLNKSFTKAPVQNARNAMVIDSIFNVFANHMSEVAEYNAFALPLVDTMKWFNYRENVDVGEGHIHDVGVNRAIRDTLGTEAIQYFVDLMTDINSSQKAGRHEDFFGKILGRSKAASVAWNTRVAIQQISALPRASMILNYKSLIKGASKIRLKYATQEMMKYSGIALWKSMGYYDLNVGKSVERQIKGDTSVVDKFNELGMWLPGKMDERTWARIWIATKDQVQNTTHLTGEDLLQATAKKFEEVVYETQVVDSVLTKSSFMRDKNLFIKEATSFMAEPTLAINILMSAFQDYEEGHSRSEKVKRGLMIGFTGYALAGVVNALLSSFSDAWRDDDEFEDYWEKYWQALFGEKFFDGNLFGELNPIEKIAFVKDILSVAKGNEPHSTYSKLMTDAVNLINSYQSIADGKGSKTAYGVVYQTLQYLSTASGVGMSNMTREVIDFWNNTIGKINPEQRILRYKPDNGEELLNAIQKGTEEDIQRVFGRFENQQQAESALQSAIKAKYLEDGLTAEETEEMLTTYFDRDDEFEIYWLMEEWDYAKANDGSSDGYTKYGSLYDAIETGDFETEIARFLEHGADASTIRSQITREYRKQYLADEAAREEIREKLLPVYEATGMYASDIEDKFNDWDFEAEYGMTYSNFKAEYREGNVTEAEMRGAMDAYGLLNYEIEEGIRDLNDDIAFEKKFGMSLSELKDAYDNGDATRNQLIDALIFTGKTKTQATEEVSERDLDNRFGIQYAKLDDAYKYNDISRSEFYNAMREHGATQQEADEAILGYDWLKKNVKKYPDLAISDAKRFVIKVSDKMEERTLTDYGVSVDAYLKYKEGAKDCPGVDADGDGKIDSYSKAKQLFAMIDQLPISDEAKDGLALVTNAESTLRKYAPWRK